MKFTTLPRHTTMMPQSLRIINSRSLLVKTVAAAGLVVALAFGGGLWAGLSVSQRAAPTGTVKIVQDPAREKLVINKLGELSARLQQLQSNAVYLVQKVGVQEEITQKLKAIDPRFTPDGLPPTPHARESSGEGGLLLPPRACDHKLAQLQDMGGHPLALPHIEQTESSVDCLDTLLDQVQSLISVRDADLMALPSSRPVDDGKLGSPFGNRVDPFTGRLAFHSGLDFPAPQGTAIYSAAGGRVIFTGPYTGYGNMVSIDHGNGFVTRYAHTSRIDVQEGDLVMPHQLIAEVGSTGRSTGPHLHFEILYHTQFINPKNFLSLGNMETAADDQALD